MRRSKQGHALRALWLLVFGPGSYACAADDPEQRPSGGAGVFAPAGAGTTGGGAGGSDPTAGAPPATAGATGPAPQAGTSGAAGAPLAGAGAGAPSVPTG